MSTDGASSVPTAPRTAGRHGRLLRFLASREFLLLAFVASVLWSFKPLVYFAVACSLAGMRWRITPARAAVYCTLVVAALIFFATQKNAASMLGMMLTMLGIFCAASTAHRPRTENRLAIWATLTLLSYCFFFTNAFDFDTGVVSQNFIPIVGLYMLMLCVPWRRSEIRLLCFLLAALVLLAGSRSGAALFLLLGLYLVSARLAVFALVLMVAALYLFGFDADMLPAQFQRNYEGGIDPRLFVWDEFLTNAFSGNLFRREHFDFMDTFGLERNFHNSVLEAYYRVGPFALLLLWLHVRLLGRVRADSVAFAVFAALLARALFDTYLWFTPIDLLVFKEYGSRLFDRKARASGRR